MKHRRNVLQGRSWGWRPPGSRKGPYVDGDPAPLVVLIPDVGTWVALGVALGAACGAAFAAKKNEAAVCC